MFIQIHVLRLLLFSRVLGLVCDCTQHLGFVSLMLFERNQQLSSQPQCIRIEGFRVSVRG